MTKTTNKGKRIGLSIVYAAVLIGLAAFGGFYFMKYNDLKNNPPAPEVQAQAEVERYQREVGELYDLPDDEEPSVATVRDKEQLGDQAFFAQAENGDVTLIYSQAKLAILYRPSTKKLINVSTLTIEDSPQVTVIGASGARGEVIAALANEQITATEGGANKSNQKTTIVIDVSGQNEATAESIASIVGGKVADLPKGEEVPEGTDILVIAVQAESSGE